MSNPITNESPIVLVIDDDPVGQTLLCEALGNTYPRILVLGSPIGASKVVSQENVGVVVLDVEMPNVRGDKLAKLFRESPRLAHVGVVLVSGCSQSELLNLGQSCGADRVVTKRQVRTELVQAVWNAWDSSAKRRAAKKKAGSTGGTQGGAPPPVPAKGAGG